MFLFTIYFFLRVHFRINPGGTLVQPKYAPSAGDLTDMARICRRVEGMPLAILLAATWMEMLTPTEIAAEVGQSLDFLETDLRDLPERQRSLRAVFDHSWRLLTEREREGFQRLSVFRGGFTRQAAQQVTNISLRELMALINKSLVHHMAKGRYEIHELLRQYAAEKLDQVPAAREAACDRHSAYYCAALQQWAVDLKDSQQQTALAEMDAEIENARAAWNWAVERGQVELLDQALEGLVRFYEWRGRYREGEAMCRVAAEKLEATAWGEGKRVWARTLAWQGAFSDVSGRTRLAEQLLKQCLTLLERTELADQDTRSERAFALLQMGYIKHATDLQEARRLYKESLALFRTLGDRWGTANALGSLGRIASDLGAYGEAKQLFEEGLAIGQALGNQKLIADSLKGLSIGAYAQGQLEESERLGRESIAIHQEIGNQDGIADGLYQLGVTLLWLGKFSEAHSLMEESVAMYDYPGSGVDLSFQITSLGFPELHRGRYEGGRTQGQRGLTLAREIDNRRAIGLSCCLLGEVALAEGAYAEAKHLLQESVTECDAIGQQRQLGWTLADLGYAARGMGQLHQARRHLYEALRTAAENRTFIPLITALPAVALLLADQGEEERAVELYTLALRYPHVANSRWFEDIVGRNIAAVAATLPSEVVAAAQERGRARDLWATATELLAELGQA